MHGTDSTWGARSRRVSASQYEDEGPNEDQNSRDMFSFILGGAELIKNGRIGIFDLRCVSRPTFEVVRVPPVRQKTGCARVRQDIAEMPVDGSRALSPPKSRECA